MTNAAIKATRKTLSGRSRVSLITKQDLSEYDVARTLWAVLDSPLIEPTRYDSVERARKSFAGAADAGSDAFANERSLFVKGAKAGFMFWARYWGGGLFNWLVYLHTKALGGSDAARWGEWIGQLCSELPVVFGSACTDEERDAKHPNLNGRTGATTKEFRQYLPGIYWKTIFGAAVVDGLGRDALLELGGVDAEPIDGGQIVLTLKDDLVPDSIEDRLATQRDLAAELGSEHFFDRDAPDADYKQIPALMTLLG